MTILVTHLIAIIQSFHPFFSRCSSDLNEFVKESHEFSSEQLFGIVAFSDHIKNQLEVLNKELASRAEGEK